MLYARMLAPYFPAAPVIAALYPHFPCTYPPGATSGYVTPSTVSSGATLTAPISGAAPAGTVTVKGFATEAKMLSSLFSHVRSRTIATPEAALGIASSHAVGKRISAVFTPGCICAAIS